MDVKTVCLGMLTDGPASGYDLKKEFESSFAHFFAAGYGSIYPALSALADDGLVNCELVPQEGKPDRKVYQITDAGHAFLLKALENEKPFHKVRSEFLAQLCFAHLMRPETVEAVLDNRLSDIADCRKVLREIETMYADDWPAGAEFVLGFGKAIYEATETYIKENRHKLTVAPVAETATG